MRPAPSPQNPDCRDKRRSLLSPSPVEPAPKCRVYGPPQEFSPSCPEGKREESGEIVPFEQPRCSSLFAATLAASSGHSGTSAEGQHTPPTAAVTTVPVCTGLARERQLLATQAASDLNKHQPVRTPKMEKPPHSHRTPEEVKLALEVLNDELADASPLDRPSLELATQALMERLVEMRKEEIPQRSSTSSSGAADKQSTHEYSQSLQAVIVGDGTQKYTLIRIPKQDDMPTDVYLVRGDPKAEYHYQTALETLNGLQYRNIMSDVTGGGRMDVLKTEKKVQIYGYSYQYGAADHSITAKMMKEHFGDDFVVSFGNYGY